MNSFVRSGLNSSNLTTSSLDGSSRLAGLVNGIISVEEFGVDQIGNEPVITAIEDGNISITIALGLYAGTYTQRVTDGVPLTVAMIEAAPTPFVLPTVSGLSEQDETLTITPGLWLFSGDDPGDQVWQQQLDGVDIAGGDGLSYVIEETSNNKDFTVEETFGGVTIESTPFEIAFTPAFAGPTALGADLHTWLDFTDVSTLFQDKTRTAAVTANGQSVLGVNDKSGNGYHYNALSLPANSPVATWDAAEQQLTIVGGVNSMFYQADAVLSGATASMEVYVALKTPDQNFPLLGSREGGEPFLARSHQSQQIAIHQLVGSPVLSTNGVNNGISGNAGLSLAQEWGTNVPIIAGAQNVDFSQWPSDNRKIQLFNCFSDQFPLQNGTVSQVVITRALTQSQRAGLIQWMESRMPV